MKHANYISQKISFHSLVLLIAAVFMIQSCGPQLSSGTDPSNTGYNSNTQTLDGNTATDMSDELCLLAGEGGDQDGDDACDANDNQNADGEEDISCVDDPYCLDPTRQETDGFKRTSSNRFWRTVAISAIAVTGACIAWNKCREKVADFAKDTFTTDDNERIAKLYKKDGAGDANTLFYEYFDGEHFTFRDGNSFLARYHVTKIDKDKGTLALGIKSNELVIVDQPVHHCLSGLKTLSALEGTGNKKVRVTTFMKNNYAKIARKQIVSKNVFETMCNVKANGTSPGSFNNIGGYYLGVEQADGQIWVYPMPLDGGQQTALTESAIESASNASVASGGLNYFENGYNRAITLDYVFETSITSVVLSNDSVLTYHRANTINDAFKSQKYKLTFQNWDQSRIDAFNNATTADDRFKILFQFTLTEGTTVSIVDEFEIQKNIEGTGTQAPDANETPNNESEDIQINAELDMDKGPYWATHGQL